MIRHVVFSENEAFKLKAFMIQVLEKGHLPVQFHLLIQADAPEFRKGYDMVIDELGLGVHCPSIVFTNKTSFLEDAMTLIDGPEDIVGLMTTDDMAFADVDLAPVGKAFLDDQMLFSFALRLGKNIEQNSMVNLKNRLVLSWEGDGIIKWDWKKHYVDFSAPLSVHGHYYRTKEISKMVRSCKGVGSFDELEESLQRFMNFPKNMMASFAESHMVSIDPIFDPHMAALVKEKANDLLLEGGDVPIVVGSLPNELHAGLLRNFLDS